MAAPRDRAALANRIFLLFLWLLAVGAGVAGWLAYKAYTQPLTFAGSRLRSTFDPARR